MIMVLFGNIHALSNRSETRSLFSIRYFSNPFLAIAAPAALCVHLVAMNIPGLNSVIGLQPISLSVFGGLVGVALLFLAVEEIHKASLRWRSRRKA